MKYFKIIKQVKNTKNANINIYQNNWYTRDLANIKERLLFFHKLLKSRRSNNDTFNFVALHNEYNDS